MGNVIKKIARTGKVFFAGIGVLAGVLFVWFLMLFFTGSYMRFTAAPETTAKSEEAVTITQGGKPLTGKDKDEAMKALDLVRTFDKALSDSTPKMTASEREEYGRNVWREIKSHMIDPEPGTYPVRFFEPKDVPLAVDQAYSTHPYWIDNRYVVYWAGILNEVMPLSGKPFSHFELVVVDTEAGKVVESIARHKEFTPICYDVKSGNFSYAFPDSTAYREGNPMKGFKVAFHFGKFDKNGHFIKVRDTAEGRGGYSNRFDCGYYPDEKMDYTGLRPGDGSVKLKPSSADDANISGNFIFTRPDGTTKEITVGSYTTPSFVYDPIRDQYYLSMSFSMEDQRSRILYYDRELNLVDEFILPRVVMQSSFPSSMLGSRSLSPAVKDGFVTGCGRRDDKPGTVDAEGVPRRQYLCHVRRDQKVVRALTGKVGALAVSPDGCRVFGLWRERNTYDQDRPGGGYLGGKNFVVDVCRTEQPKPGELK